jgi:UDP-N-acetylmuramoyl-tripeptide--D-alanyl-D-alanine ligase
MMYLSEAAIATHGKFAGEDVLFTSVGTDSRAVTQGQLFVALRGENFDGHAFAQQSLTQGAVAAMVSTASDNLSAALVVEDTRLALGELAAYWRGKFDLPVIAITGSNGKTTVKEMLAAILRSVTQETDAVLATQGNLNNDIGLPLTLLKLRDQHRYAVVEMGMNHAGEIAYLTNIGRPDVALVNNATQAHMAGLGSVEAIAQAKGEIFSGLTRDGIAVINADDAFAPLWKGLATPHKVLTFGVENPADVSACYQLDDCSSRIDLQTPKGAAALRLSVPGLHNVRNALAAASAALAIGIPLQVIVQGLENYSGVQGRLQYKAGINGAQVIDDTYNANPASMKAAIDVLAARAGEKWLVLGDMGELGEDAATMHAEIGRYARQAGIHALFALGNLSRETVAAFGMGAQHYEDMQTLVEDLLQGMQSTMTVLVKGSRFMRMERVADLIAVEKNREKH